MKNSKKHSKAHRTRRNAAPAAIARLPRAFARRRSPTSNELAVPGPASWAEDSHGWRLVKALGGGIGTTVVGSLLEHQATVPAKWVSLGIAALGAGLAYGSPNRTLRSVGVGAAAAGTSLLGRVLIDEELFRREENNDDKKGDKPRLASGAQPSTSPTPVKKQSNASDIPADALARAYERARLRMALASDAPN